MMWGGMKWYGVAWRGVMWYEVVWCDVVCCGMVWGALCSLESQRSDHVPTKTQLSLFFSLLFSTSPHFFILSYHHRPSLLDLLSLPLVLSLRRNVTDMTPGSCFCQQNLWERTYILVRTYTHTYIHIYIHTHTHIHTRTHIHTHVHTYIEC